MEGDEHSDLAQRVASVLQERDSQPSVVGTDVKNTGMVQVVLESNVNGEAVDLTRAADAESKYKKEVFHATLVPSPFSPNGVATSPVFEYVRSWFPVSKLTVGFQRKIESDVAKFESTSQIEDWHRGVSCGWTVEEEDHEGEKCRSFLVMRGWDSMKRFEQFLETESFENALPILLAWGAPYKMAVEGSRNGLHSALQQHKPAQLDVRESYDLEIAADRAVLAIQVSAQGINQQRVGEDIKSTHNEVLFLLQPLTVPALNASLEQDNMQLPLTASSPAIVRLGVKAFEANCPRWKQTILGERPVFSAEATYEAEFADFDALGNIIYQLTKLPRTTITSIKHKLSEQVREGAISECQRLLLGG